MRLEHLSRGRGRQKSRVKYNACPKCIRSGCSVEGEGLEVGVLMFGFFWDLKTGLGPGPGSLIGHGIQSTFGSRPHNRARPRCGMGIHFLDGPSGFLWLEQSFFGAGESEGGGRVRK